MSNKRSASEVKSGTQEKNPKESEDKEPIEGTKKPKLAFSIGKKTVFQITRSPNAIHNMKETPKPVKSSLRETFNSESEEEEEMPAEARMRMRNVGRDTPTSAGPNSFGKTKQGFCDAKKVFEKKLRAAAESVAES